MLKLSQNGCSVWVASSSNEELLTPTAVALGKFDGVHLGHQRVIQPILHSGCSQETQQTNIYTNTLQRLYSTVVTFDPHPHEFFTGQPRALLTPLDEKVAALRSLGVQQLVLLPFDRELSALSPQEFVDNILIQQLQCQKISVGEDFCFGKKRQGTAQDLKILAAQYNIPVTIVPIKTDTDSLNVCPDAPISTSLIRENLEAGNIEKANRLLGRPYTLNGIVVEGQKLGRTIGFPTANLQLPKDKFLPHYGVYAIKVLIPQKRSDISHQEKLGVMNIGKRPTVNGINTSIEVHLFNWHGDLYRQELIVQLVQFLRPEQKFSSLEALKNQIQQDCTIAQQILKV
ncbi:bifunctional riboflavin kinase/FAD synthetase [Anabaena sp. FACHB-1237]|uniref:bifunctional riboflavin kinase/FAD synthetase n=1 Tax=Anabaena sp. FACHB-1237 TaxID=2692769 RepID=UPI001681024C|nr:bifunctional riboflavin kinase/FAD synthetase [Anabaena sp. FACHB-1237]MBD2137300.1 bifunctional riboflavin kinase/FAD synthetase [Anabaena sp. FACHB-1237]